MKKLLILAGALALPSVAAGDMPSPYAGQQNRAIKALSAQEIDDLRAGRGMGLAKAAELNGYPGPIHVLQLADRLGLTPEQRAATESLFSAMQADAQRLGTDILDTEQALERDFAGGVVAESGLRQRLDALAALQGDLRFVHLRAHLAQAELLTTDQRRLYDALRGYSGTPAEGGHPPHGSRGH